MAFLLRCSLQCATRGLWYSSLPELAVYAAFGGRFMSTQPSTPSFKAQTRALLKKVHPDLFHDNQEAREANERSFKLLQEYLAAAKTGGGIGRTAGLPYHFTFFIREQLAEAQATEDEEGSGAAGELRRVALTLPPPTKTGPGDSLSPSTRKAFARLLEACGIPAELPPEGQERHYSKITNLREFLPQAAEQVHQAATQQAGPRQQLGAVRTALRLGRNAVLSFAEPASSAGPVQQLALAQQLLAVLDSLPDVDVSGLKVTVGEAYGVDALGTIWLHAGDSLQAWARYLSNVDTGYCHERQALQARVRKQEVALARLLRVPLVYTHPQVSLDPPYLDFLQRTTAAAADRGPIREGRFQDVPILVHPDPSQSLDAEETVGAQGPAGHASGKQDPLSEPSLDDAAGIVLVPMTISPADLYSAMARLGPAAQAVLRRTREEENAAAALRTAVERKLRLRRLIRDPGLTPERFRAACMRLMHHSPTLQPLLEGLAVRVAELNGLPPDRSFVDIAWDFEL